MSVPREARPYQGRHAGVATRLAAAILDAAAVVAILLSGYGMVAVLTFMIDPVGFSLPRLPWAPNLGAALAVAVVYLAAGWSGGGRTWGMSVMGLRIVGPGGRRPRPGRAAVRALACVLFPVGLLWSAVSTRNRSVQDVLLRTEVIYDWRSGRPGTEPSTTDDDHRRGARQGVSQVRGQGGSAVLVVLVVPAVLMIGALLLERLERKAFTPSHRSVSTSDTEAGR